MCSGVLLCIERGLRGRGGRRSRRRGGCGAGDRGRRGSRSRGLCGADIEAGQNRGIRQHIDAGAHGPVGDGHLGSAFAAGLGQGQRGFTISEGRQRSGDIGGGVRHDGDGRQITQKQMAVLVEGLDGEAGGRGIQIGGGGRRHGDILQLKNELM